ncbi:phytoene/squalene synthase family protein [Naumannella halotolerans]|uniref:Phytoene synthase n=1 Tax=Naumannella halotolerans TaxID=993414 RepID=A0A4R7JCH8_9ACTN|nr:phytoene/squalene synthase family protein [Naumannella halotolerans]TDT34417.1 phytoene synthase [Naumannella halotolerans]
MTDTAMSDSEHIEAGYAQCSRLTWAHGTTYFWGAMLLPKQDRRHVHAVYALCRLADDIVDAPGATLGPANTATRQALQDFRAEFDESLRTPHRARPVFAAIATSVRSAGIEPECFDRFFDAMAMDLVTDSYQTWQDLLGYMEGSAAVIGEMMLPVLHPRSARALRPARALGFAFQLTNFLRDVGEDLQRGRVYLPQEDLRRFGTDPADRRNDRAWREMLAFQIARNRELYAIADEGLTYLPRPSATCVGTARVLYSQILDRIEANDYDVFARRARVPLPRKAATAALAAIVGPTVHARMHRLQPRSPVTVEGIQ